MSSQKVKKGIDRREFLRSTAALGAGVVLAPKSFGQAAGSGPDDINVALLGAGAQGQVLLNTCLKIPGVRFKAVCDIWTAYNQKRVSRLLKKYRHEHNTYVDYQEMLDKEKDLDAVLIATPDFWHTEHTVACLKAGLDVYCEKEMSNTLEGARKMVQAVKEAGKLLQIGHQRRSNPRYIHCCEKLIKEAKLLGRITTINGQGYFETFMGDEGTLVISESAGRGAVYREPSAPEWDKWVKAGYVNEPALQPRLATRVAAARKKEEKPETGAVLDVRETMAPPAYELPVKMEKLYHQPHLENFFDAIRGKAKLNCPVEIGYKTAVTILKVNEAVEAARRLDFKPGEFTA
ncbi:Inositol 2-dehydrogenase/D-chiro-inositol 3-dehydrogenase [subsurface metagenome]